MSLKPPVGPNTPFGTGQSFLNLQTDFGAHGDGSDVTDAVAAAALASVATPVFVPPGTYRITPTADGAVVCPNGTRFAGVGGQSIFKSIDSPGVGKTMFGVRTGAYANFEGLTFQGPDTWGGTTATVTGIGSYLQNDFPTQVKVDDCRFIGLAYCLRFKGVTRLLLDRCELDGLNAGTVQTDIQGIHIADDTGGSFVGCTNSQWRGFGTNDGTGLSHAFYPYNSVSFAFSDCTFDQTCDGEVFSPHNQGSVPTNVPYGVLSGCRFTFSGTNYGAVRTMQYGKMKIVGCHFDANSAIYMTGDTIIDNCDFVNTTAPTSNAAITELSAVSALHATISNNRFTNSNNIDIQAQIAAGSTFIITGNDFASGSNNAHFAGTAGTSPTVISTGNVYRGQNATCDAIDMFGSGTVKSTGDVFSNGRDAIRIEIGSTVSRVSAVGSEFNQTGSSFNFAAQPTKVFTSGNYGTKLETEQATAIASAATITLPPASEFFTVSGTTNITSVTASWAGRRVTLLFAGILTFTDGSNLKLAGNFVTTADDTITLVSDGTNWVETARSVN